MKRLLCLIAMLALTAAWGAAYAAEQESAPATTGASAPAAAQAPAPKAPNQPPTYFVPTLPAELSLCGTRVPLERRMVAEQLERELIIVVHDPAQVIMWLKRAWRYFPYIEGRLKAKGMPQDIKYLAVAESSLIHYIRSPPARWGPGSSWPPPAASTDCASTAGTTTGATWPWPPRRPCPICRTCTRSSTRGPWPWLPTTAERTGWPAR